MKVAALDIGDVWTGVALSDALKLTAKPYKTVQSKDLINFLETLLTTESISTIIVGNPKTMKGTESQQTRKVHSVFTSLTHKYPHLEWKLWDERLSSKYAQSTKKAKTKDDKIQSHSIAAAFILSSYLSFLS